MNPLPKIALIGRANVGKSTLFNTLGEQKKALVSNVAGTTRDRNYTVINWRGFAFELIDTGGIDIVHPRDIEKDIIKQTDFAQQEADLILFLVDLKDGLMPQDKEVAQMIKKSQKPVILVANKADSIKLRNAVAEFYKLNLGEPLPVSAVNGSGTGDLLDEVIKKIKTKKITTADTRQLIPDIRIAIIGKPNTGKSTLVNSILGEERVITSPTPYTTRDAQDIVLIYKEQPYILIDTAGIRKKAKIKNKLEKISVNQALASLTLADVTLLLTDVSEPLSQQDKTLADEIGKSHSSIIIVANKWDLVSGKNSQTINKFVDYYRAFFPFLKFAPIIFISALEKQRVKKVLDLAKEIYMERYREITENALDKFFKKIIKLQPPTRGRGAAPPRLYQLKQLGVAPPKFEIIKDYKSYLHESYVRYIEKRLREKFNFLGAPIVISIRRLKSS